MSKALWFDEIFSTRLYLNVSLSAEPGLFQYVPDLDEVQYARWGNDWRREHAYHPPLFLVFYYTWTRFFGDSELSLHIPTLIAGILGIIIMYFLGSLIFGNDVSFMATLAVCVSSPHVMYSVEAMYMIFEALAFLLSLLFFCKFIITKDPKAFWYLLACNILGVFVFYHYFFYLIVQTLALWILRDKLMVKKPYFIGVFLSVLIFFLFVIINYGKGYYSNSSYWGSNDLKHTIDNIITLPSFYRLRY